GGSSGVNSGGGLLTNGASGANGGKAFVNGGDPGFIGSSFGGFGGGGGGSGNTRGGGGGGYSGGGGGFVSGNQGASGTGGGGGSFNAGTNQMATGGLNEGDGQLVISWTVQPPIISQIAGFPPGSTFPVGMTTNTFVATDASGNTDTCSFTLTVVDTTFPNAVCVDNLDVFLDGNGNASISFTDIENGSTDNCGIVSFRLDDSTFTCSNTGMNLTAILNVEDAAGNQDTCQTAISVLDTITPVIPNCLDTTIYVNDMGMVTFTNDGPGPFALGTDNCSLSENLIIEQYDCDDVGNTFSVAYNTGDPSGNSASCDIQVTVLDTLGACNQPPVAVCQDV
ncbi:MAG: HYR domain-containing protein, partial [Bacteroidota bacterium]